MTLEHVLERAPGHVTGLASARLAYRAAVGVAIAIVSLHLLKPEIEPSWRFISEYALGRYGWLMSLTFVTFGVAHVALAFDLRRFRSASWPARLAPAAMAITAAGLILAGVFTTDAITTDPSAVTTSGRMHNLGGAMGIAMPFAVGLVTWQLFRHPSWHRPRKTLVCTAVLAIVGTVVNIVSLGVLLSGSAGTFGPDVPVGWPNRFELATYLVWFFTVARSSLAIGGEDR